MTEMMGMTTQAGHFIYVSVTSRLRFLNCL